jgi:hypothetical protein
MTLMRATVCSRRPSQLAIPNPRRNAIAHRPSHSSHKDPKTASATMVNFSSAALAFLPLFPSVSAFSAQTLPLSKASQPSPFPRSRYVQPTSTTLGIGAEFIDLDPDEVIPLGEECIITPEGYGFSASMGRILDAADRENGFYRARASEIVTDVMEGITIGKADVALVFDDSSDKILGIFTETDYIKVGLGLRHRLHRLSKWVVFIHD